MYPNLGKEQDIVCTLSIIALDATLRNMTTLADCTAIDIP